MVKVCKVGDRMTVAIPAEVVSKMAIAEGTDLDVFVREDSIVLQPTKSRWDRLVDEVRSQAAARGLTEDDVAREIAAVRHRSPRIEVGDG